MSKIKFFRNASFYLEPIYFFTVISASIFAIIAFLYTVSTDKSQEDANRIYTWNKDAIYSIINNSEKSTMSFQEIKDQYQNKINREETTTGNEIPRQYSSDDYLRYTLQNFVESGVLKSKIPNQYIIVSKQFDFVNEFPKYVAIQDKIEKALIGRRLTYNIQTLYTELAKEGNIDQLDYIKVMGGLMSTQIVFVDDKGLLFHVTDSRSSQ